MPIKKDKISFKVNLTEELDKREITGNKRKQAAEAAGNTALSFILEYTESEQSPVKQKPKGFKELSKEYKKFKRKKGKGTRANLRLNEEMLPSMRVVADKESFTIKITDRDEKLKAHGHNTGGRKLPKRQFLPDDENKEELRTEIQKAYLKMLEEYKDAKK